jgi:hypothetical protein
LSLFLRAFVGRRFIEFRVLLEPGSHWHSVHSRESFTSTISYNIAFLLFVGFAGRCSPKAKPLIPPGSFIHRPVAHTTRNATSCPIYQELRILTYLISILSFYSPELRSPWRCRSGQYRSRQICHYPWSTNQRSPWRVITSACGGFRRIARSRPVPARSGGRPQCTAFAEQYRPPNRCGWCGKYRGSRRHPRRWK